jgi:hypothetical protein
MQNARLMVAFGIAALALGACNKQQQPAQDQNIAIDSDVPDNVVGNADIETLPPDESSVTPSNQLENGFDNPDVNDVGNTTANSY